MAVGSYLLGLGLALLLALGQPVVIESSRVTLNPLRVGVPLQPLGSDCGEDIQSMAHGLADQLQAVEATHHRQNAGGVGALLTTLLDEPHLTESLK